MPRSFHLNIVAHSPQRVVIVGTSGDDHGGIDRLPGNAADREDGDQAAIIMQQDIVARMPDIGGVGGNAAFLPPKHRTPSPSPWEGLSAAATASNRPTGWPGRLLSLPSAIGDRRGRSCGLSTQ